ncbi:MAG: TonB-dependent receptor plug domain-containing protein [Verrucomicrobiota bacterium]
MNPVYSNASVVRSRRFARAALIATLPALLGSFALAQTAPATPVTAPAANEETLKLSPFEVRPDEDSGYQATNTTSGSRLATNLKDTAASISPFTPEFLSDIGATNVAEMLAYATNAELNAGDAEGAGFNNPRDFSSAGGEPYRIRGIPANTSTDYVENSAPTDLYNIERAEVASGANSILFGSGDAGGLVSLQTKKANLNRSRYSGTVVVGNWAHERFSTDLNQVLIAKKLALRLNALYQNTGSWREYQWGEDQNRYTASVAFRPFSRTTINAAYENGVSKKSVGLGWNASDQFTVWNSTGRTLAETAPANAAALGLLSLGANQRFTYFPQDGVVYNMRNELRTTSAPTVTAQTLLPPSIFPYDVNWAGPDVQLHRTFNNGQVSIEQRITDTLTIQGAWFHNETDSRARSFIYQGNVMDLLGDPNPTLPAPNGTGTVVNPHAQQVYLEAGQNYDTTFTENEVKRITVAYQFKGPRWLGEHGLVGLWENAVQDRATRARREILVNQNSAPVQNVGAPENAQNLVLRRSYLTEGDYSTYALRGLYDPIQPFDYLGNTLTPRNITTGELISRKDVDSLLFAAQSTWFNRPEAKFIRRFTTTLGYRQDKIKYYDTTSGRVQAGDPRIASGERILNEVAALPGFNRNDITAKTKTFGGVLQLTKRFSVLYNQSSNIGAPRFDRRILPDGRIPPTPEGENQEYGAMIDVLGDDRFFIRINYFDTAQVGDAAVSPSGAVTNNTSALGRPQTLAVLDAFVAAGRLTQAQSDLQRFNWNAALIDTATTGYEVEFVANPTRNWTVRAGYSHSERSRENFFEEGRAFFDIKFAEWRTMAGTDAALRQVVETNIADIELTEFASRDADTEQGFGSIPHKANLTTKYTFNEGTFRGFSLGGSVRYQSKIFAQTLVSTGRSFWSNEAVAVDAFTTYKFKAPWLKGRMSVQLNVKNLTNSYLSSVARLNGDFSGPRRLYLKDPRSYRLTANVEF